MRRVLSLMFGMLGMALFVLMPEALLRGQNSQEPGKAKQDPKAQDKVKAKQKDNPAPKKPRAAQPEDIHTLPGFKVELVYEAPEPGNQLSWINLGQDGEGRLILGAQRGQPLYRFTIKDGKVNKLEKLDIPLSEPMGILWAFDTLYMNANGPKGYGLYKCKEVSPAKFEVEFLKRFEGSGEHGPHGMAVGPDNKIYIMNGNHTKVPEGMAKSSPHRNYKEDHLLPRQWDGNGHAAGILAPGGYVVRTDKDGKEWEIVLAGFRNAYDMAFNGDGEAFTFDSDMEWDWGMPWYRPVRVNHCTSAAEFGWRSGTGKWPAYYPDSLPATVDIGIGSPVGVTNGHGAKFPAKYQKCIYVLDWTYGRLIAVHLTPKGSSYTATWENFVCPKGLVDSDVSKKALPLTDALIGRDGAMYFTIGGRNNQAALYRVTYLGTESTAPAELANLEGSRERTERRALEAFHGKEDPKAVAAAWKHLGSEDRFLRYAARLALESQPVATWSDKALQETEPQAALTAALALARCSDTKRQPELLAALERLPLAKLPDELKLEKLRVLGLSFIRQGRPSLAAAKKIITELDPLFPGPNEWLNREIAIVLIYLNAPGIAGKCLAHVKNCQHQEDQFHYLFHMRTIPIGFWTIEQRKEYFAYFTAERKKLPPPEAMVKWFRDAGRSYADGSSFSNFLKNFVREAVLNLSEAERKELAPLIAKIDKDANPVYDIKPRPIVKAWRIEDLVGKLDQVEKGRNFDNGKAAYLASSCIKCHRMGNEGGPVGPDLTAVSTRFDRRALLESIIEPSKVISDQYQNEDFVTLSGKNLSGRVVDETPDKWIIQPNPLEPTRFEIAKNDVDTRKPSKFSPMPANLVDVLTEEEILDLIAYLESGGNRGYKSFQKK